MDITQSVGNTNELLCMADFIKRGYECCIPYGNSAKYDFIVQKEDKFYKIQCKASHYSNKNGVVNQDAIEFNTVRATTNTKETKKYHYSKEEVDYFATHFNNQTYLVPLEECSHHKTLWLIEPPLSNCSKAEDYSIDVIFPYCVKIPEAQSEYLKELDAKRIYRYCIDCGKPIREGTRCKECAKKAIRKVERPNRDILKQEIRKLTLRDIGKKYNVSDTAIKKWCKYYKLPSTKTEIKAISDQDWVNI